MAESRSSFIVGQADVASAGTPEQLPMAVIGQGAELVVKAKKDNTGAIKVGHDSDSAQNSPFTLEPGEHVRLRIGLTDKVWIDAEQSGNGVEYVTET